MKSGKSIEVSKSSLVSLKAELLRKQEEALKAKSSESYVKAQPKPKKVILKNKGVDERSQKDEVSQEEIDALKKSREVLEIKAKLYEKLEKRELVSEGEYLVNFGDKDDRVEEAKAEEEEKISSDDYSSDDSEWTEYVDCLGRSRKCLKEDLAKAKARDAELCERLGDRAVIGPSQEVAAAERPPDGDAIPDERKLELMSNDMQREVMRQKWEEQEKHLANKKNIYYEDVRFDEARSHGVAYYGLSTDEGRREEQQAEFKRVREETEARQREARSAKERREAMKQARLMAARQRQRERLGLPPLSVPDEEEDGAQESAKEDEEKPSTSSKDDEDNSEEIEAKLKRLAHVRPWDVGKDGVNQPDPVMSQEEWVEKKRSERDQEFAPPTSFDPKGLKTKKKKKRREPRPAWKDFEREEEEVSEDWDGPGPSVPAHLKIDTSVPPPTIKKHSLLTPKATVDVTIPPPLTKRSGSEGLSTSTGDAPFPPLKRQRLPTAVPLPTAAPLPTAVPSPTRSAAPPRSAGACVPPPISFTFNTPTSRLRFRPTTSSKAADMMDSIEAGLQFLRDESERREKLIGKK